MAKIYILFGLCFFCISAKAQISTDEQPISFGLPVDVFDREVDIKTMPGLDMERIQEEDERDEQDGLPPRFGYPHEVNFDLNNSGVWVSLPNGDRIWQLSIHCPQALSINLLFLQVLL